MAKSRRIPACVTLKFLVPCGKGKHQVMFDAAAWGQVTVSNPCDILSPAARKLAQSSCAELVPDKILAIEQRLQTIWCSRTPTETSPVLPAAAWNKLNEFVDFVRDQKESLAEQLLAPGSGEFPLGDESGYHPQCWATLVLAARHPERVQALLADNQRWPSAILIAALCGYDWGQDSTAVLLVDQAVQDPQIIPYFREQFALLLGEIGLERHAAILIDAVCDNEPKIRSAALKGLERLCARFRARRLVHVLTVTLERAYEKLIRGEQRIVVWLTDWARPHLELLMDAVAAGEPSIRILAANLLEQLADVRAAEALSRAACDRHPEVSQAATSGLVVLGPALVQAGEDSVPLLANALGGRSDRLTLFALDALRKIGSPRGADSVLRVLRRAGTQELKIATIATLGTIGDERAVEPLLKRLNDRNHDVPLAAAQALAAVLDHLVINASSFPYLRLTLACRHPLVASTSLRRLTEPGSPEAVRLVVDSLPGLDEQLQVQALVALRELDHSKVLGPLLEFLAGPANSREAQVTEHAVLTTASLLRKLTGVSGTGLVVLVKALECPYVQVAREAAKALEPCSDLRVVSSLLKACLRGDRPLSQAAGRCLKQLASAEQVAWLTQLLWHGDDCMARGAEAALIAIGSRAVESLAKAVNWPFLRARLAAVRALGTIGGPGAVDALQKTSRDADLRVRQMATAALHTIHVPRA